MDGCRPVAQGGTVATRACRHAVSEQNKARWLVALVVVVVVWRKLWMVGEVLNVIVVRSASDG